MLNHMVECGGEVTVTKQVVVSFLIGKYVDEVLGDVVPMQASHILLGSMMCIMGIIIHLVKLKLICKRIQMVQ